MNTNIVMQPLLAGSRPEAWMKESPPTRWLRRSGYTLEWTALCEKVIDCAQARFRTAVPIPRPPFDLLQKP